MAICLFGDGTAAPPALSRTIIEQQRAANKISRLLRAQFPATQRYNIEAQFTASTTRLVVHYGTQQFGQHTVELDYTAGDPLDDSGWLQDMATLILSAVKEGISQFYISHELDHYHIMDDSEHCIYEFGKAWFEGSGEQRNQKPT